MKLDWLLGLIHEKKRDHELDEAIEKFYEHLSADSKKEFKHMIKEVALRIDHEEAVEIVRHMKPYGEHWPMDQIRQYIASKSVTPEKALFYYLVMNMAYNDYKHTADRFGLEEPEFYFCIAHDFIEDPDGKDFKVEKYFL